jgi:hypothetical protein
VTIVSNSDRPPISRASAYDVVMTVYALGHCGVSSFAVSRHSRQTSGSRCGSSQSWMKLRPT